MAILDAALAPAIGDARFLRRASAKRIWKNEFPQITRLTCATGDKKAEIGYPVRLANCPVMMTRVCPCRFKITEISCEKRQAGHQNRQFDRQNGARSVADRKRHGYKGIDGYSPYAWGVKARSGGRRTAEGRQTKIG